MAGFDFNVPRHPTGEALQRALLRWIQRTARRLGLQFKYRTDGLDLWGELDGPLPVMYALRAYLDQDIETYAAAAAVPANRQQRLRIASRLMSAFDEGLHAITEQVHELANGFGGVPNSIVFDYGTKSHLARPLQALTRTLILDVQGRIARRTTFEDVHTVMELLLRTALGRASRGVSFAGMVDEIEARGALAPGEASDVKKLSNFRRESKHRGQGFDEAEAERLVVESVGAIQKLLAYVRRPT